MSLLSGCFDEAVDHLSSKSYEMFCFADSRAVGYRFGPHLNEVVPLLISYCHNASENDDELRENSLQV